MNFKAYIHDKQLIFTNLVLILIGLYNVLLVVLRVDATQSVAIIRNNTTLGLAGFEKSSTSSLYQFALIALIIVVSHSLLAVRLRPVHRSISTLVLSLGIVVQIFALIVTSSILSLHR